mgnify:CR=1 FL=1
MASVEDIYRKIRRGETADLKFSRPSDEELALGVERIRHRLSKMPEGQILPKARLKLIWLAPAALAAIAIIAITLIPKRTPAPVYAGFATGTTSKFGSVEVRVLTASIIEHEFTQGKFLLHLSQGAIAVKRTAADTALVILTPQGVLTAQGTAFIVEHEKETSIELSEGRLEWRKDKQVHILDEKNPRIGHDLSELHKFVPAGYMKFPVNARPSAPATPRAGTFRLNDCVIYTVGGNRRHGTIKEVVHGEYRLAHEGIDEPDLFSGSSLIGCGDQ